MLLENVIQWDFVFGQRSDFIHFMFKTCIARSVGNKAPMFENKPLKKKSVLNLELSSEQRIRSFVRLKQHQKKCTDPVHE